MGCYDSDGIALRGDDRRIGQWKQITDSNTLSSLSLWNESSYYDSNNTVINTTTQHNNNDDFIISHVDQTTTILTGDIVVVLMINTPLCNINHIFHDDFWPTMAYFSQPSKLQNLQQHSDDTVATVNVTLVHDYSSPWLTSLVEIIVQAYPWWNAASQLPSYNNRWICTSQSQTQKLYVSGYIRDMHYYQLPELIRIRNDLRSVAYQKVTTNYIWAKLLEDSNETTTPTESL